MPVLEKRYAEALLSTAKDPQEANRLGEALHDFCASLEKDADTYHFLTAPDIPGSIRKETIKKIFPDDELKLIVNFLSLLIDKNRIEMLPGIQGEYRLLKDVRQNKLEIKLSSAIPLEESQENEIIEKFKKQYGATSAYVTKVINPSLLGGVLIQIGDIRIDDTQLGRLQALKKSINDINTV